MHKGLTARVFAQTVLIEKLFGLIGGFVKELLHCDFAKGKGLPVARVFRVFVEIIALWQRIFHQIIAIIRMRLISQELTAKTSAL